MPIHGTRVNSIKEERKKKHEFDQIAHSTISNLMIILTEAVFLKLKNDRFTYSQSFFFFLEKFKRMENYYTQWIFKKSIKFSTPKRPRSKGIMKTILYNMWSFMNRTIYFDNIENCNWKWNEKWFFSTGEREKKKKKKNSFHRCAYASVASETLFIHSFGGWFSLLLFGFLYYNFFFLLPHDKMNAKWY